MGPLHKKFANFWGSYSVCDSDYKTFIELYTNALNKMNNSLIISKILCKFRWKIIKIKII